MQDTCPYVLAALQQVQQVLLGHGEVLVYMVDNHGSAAGAKRWMLKCLECGCTGYQGCTYFLHNADLCIVCLRS